MDWTDSGIVLSARRHGDSSAILTLLTLEHGRHAGLVRGGFSRTKRGILQAGNVMAASWRARLEEHLGNYTIELESAHSPAFLDDPDRLSALTSACAMAEAALPEREPHEKIYLDFLYLLEALPGPHWAAAYICWEIGLLADLGFGLDLATCAATGACDDLVYVSPKSGRAVSKEAGAPYRDKLLPLPQFLRVGEADSPQSQPPPSTEAVLEGLNLTGTFLERHVFAPHHKGLPPARHRLVDRLTGITTISGV
ncbi:MAG: DNA repair protein RecO [Rhodospirillaceae bacterium]|jgi:DNA repair protein RecO (recombination protein O)|nr:DNA repair protein RecO [Rhodospirillaceae bacterium]MBT5374003.1 DNA repair protein RecO [Rhodospirillaceae bacterium]MBT5752479.1 DNA repair protein RecO [Rhodospirillaceae bacterium]